MSPGPVVNEHFPGDTMSRGSALSSRARLCRYNYTRSGRFGSGPTDSLPSVLSCIRFVPTKRRACRKWNTRDPAEGDIRAFVYLGEEPGR